MDQPAPDLPPGMGPDTLAEGERRRAAERQADEAAARPLYQQGRNGSNWFYWVAGLSLVNSISLHTGGNVFFVVGLGVTLVADTLAQGVAEHHPEGAATAKALAFGFDIVAE